jgi:hypothetical protein
VKPPSGYSDPAFGARGDDPEYEILEDITFLKQHCENLYEDFGCTKVEVGSHRLWRVLANIQPILSRNAATPNPSLFKRSAAFTIAFMEYPPLDYPFIGGGLPKTITSISNHHNAIAAFEFCRRALITGEILKRVPGKKKEFKSEILSRPIKVSQHFYWDTIHAISTINSDTCFHTLSLLYESLTYKDNPDASYPQIV